MRDSNSTSFQTSSRPQKSGRCFFVAIAMMIGLAGCSKMADQPISFQPTTSPPSLSAAQNQNINEILERQNEMRLAELEAAAAAEAEEALAAAAAGEAKIDELVDTQADLAIAQQDEIINHAALRASSPADESTLTETPAEFGVALVGFETEVDPFEEGLLGVAKDSSEDNEAVRLSASIDDLENVPQNITREESLFAGNNLSLIHI